MNGAYIIRRRFPGSRRGAGRLFLKSQDIGANLFECSHRLRLVEMAGEADLVSDADVVTGESDHCHDQREVKVG